MPGLPTRFPDRDEIASVRAEAELLEAGEEGGEERRLAGRVMARRGHGKLVFLDLVDRSGRIQLLCETERTGPVDLDLGDLVGALGRPAKTKRGEPSLAVDGLELLAKIARPLPDTFHGLVDAETRYRKRYLDLLVNEETRRDFLIRSRMISAIRQASRRRRLRRGRDARRSSRATAAPSRSRSSRARTRSTSTSTCGSRPSSTSSA